MDGWQNYFTLTGEKAVASATVSYVSPSVSNSTNEQSSSTVEVTIGDKD